MNKITPIDNHENICFKCLQIIEPEKINKHYMFRGYGSIFDDLEIHLNLCDNCEPKNLKAWFDEKPFFEKDDFTENYYFEKFIFDFLASLPVQGKEIVYNRLDSKSSIKMEPQDWIDYELGLLSKEHCEEYGLYYKPNSTPRITFEQFINTFNFKDYFDIKKEDTKIIRIYLPISDKEDDFSNWFEFGINDFHEDKINNCRLIFSEKIFSSFVETIEENNNIFTIYLTEEKYAN